MQNDFITTRSKCLGINKEEYLLQLSFASSRIRQDKKIELDMMQEYSGRELYEMIQNADDEGSPKIEIVLEDGNLHIKNWGKRPFTEGGLLSIMRSFLSTKTGSAYKDVAVKPIGNKGLGFRSLLNWSDEITIHTNGVKCSFSKEIARREWEDLKEKGLKNGIMRSTDVDSFESEREGKIPLPILSIPKVNNDDITKEGEFNLNGFCTTDIEIRCKTDDIRADIEEKLKTLPTSVILFLRNISEIDIICRGERRQIIKKSSTYENDEIIKRTVISDNNNETTFVIGYFQSPDKSYEVGVAYSEKYMNSQKVLYSYFPTHVRLDSPAIYHGTFELDASRNHLVKSSQNETVLNKLGEIAVRLSDHLANSCSIDEDRKLDAFKILNLLKIDVESAMMNPLAESIKKNLDKVKVFPTAHNGKQSISTAIWISKPLAAWLEINESLIPQNSMMSNHLTSKCEPFFDDSYYLAEYISKNFQKHLDAFQNEIEDIASVEMSIENRVCFIDSLSLSGKCNGRFSILVDANNEIIKANNENQAYILSMKGNTVLPKCLNINAVHSLLVSFLQKKWNADPRKVTEKLQGITTVINGDHTAIRKKIESWSSKEITIDGMSEVMKWEYDNPTQESTPFTSDLYLINKNGEKSKACQMILDMSDYPEDLKSKVDGNYWLYGDVSYWKNLLNAENDKDAEDFIYNTIGVSQYVPQINRYFGDDNDYLETARHCNNKSQIANWYFNNFNSNNKITKQRNYAYVPEEDFLKNFSLSEALGLILLDDRVFHNIMNTNISLFYRCEKSETVKFSYSSYVLRSYEQFKPLQTHVINSSIFGNNIDYDYLEKTLKIDKTTKIFPLLLSLGAQTNVSSFSLQKLYELLYTKADTVGIQKRYKELREAIRNKNVDRDELTIIKDNFCQFVWARKEDKLEWLPVKDVYYWDNDQLPQSVLSTLPKLEIGNRVGEESVSQIFGVKLAKNIDIQFCDFEPNETLTNEIRKYLSERIKYFLAYRIGDDVKNASLIRQSVNALKQLFGNIHVYKKSSYVVNGETLPMKDGDLITTHTLGKSGLKYVICSSHINCSNAVKDPVFCENLNEAVCMALRVTSTAMANYFRNVITQEIKYVDYLKNKDIAKETWELALKNLGLSEFEQRFWCEYSNAHGGKLDIGRLSEHIPDARDYILSIYPGLSLPEDYTEVCEMQPKEKYELLLSMNVKSAGILGEGGLKEFYMDYFDKLKNKYSEEYNAFLYEQYKTKILENPTNAESYVHEYMEGCQRFNEPFYESAAEDNLNSVLQENDLTSIFKSLLTKQFDFDPSDVKSPNVPSIGAEYLKILNEHHMSEGTLPQEVRLLTTFPNLEDIFTKKIVEYERNNENEVLPLSDNNQTPLAKIVFSNCQSYLKVSSGGIKGRKQNKATGGYVSDRAKYRAGKNAELATFRSMKESPLFEDVVGHSLILNKESGDDNLHYDITYRRKGSALTDTRYLEVKAMSTDTIIMSCLEYEFAKEHCEQYDFALFYNGEVHIVECPFSRKNGKKPLDVHPESYQINIKLN